MTNGMILLLMTALFLGFGYMGVPVAFALMAGVLVACMLTPISMQSMIGQMFHGIDSEILLAVPFFLLVGELMTSADVTNRMIRLAQTMVGHLRGGLAQVVTLFSMFFAGISGSSTADAASQSKIFIDAQTREGYDLSFSIAITAVSAVLAVIIPPSILMIVWGGILTVSIGALFLAGIIPGLLIGVAQMATVHAYAKARGYPTYPRETWRALICATWIAVPALMTPGIIIGGKIFGWFTATESACIAVLYAGVLSLLVYREMDLKGLYAALLDTGKLAGIALFCVGTASTFGWLLAYYKIPEAILTGVSAWGMGFAATGFFIAFVFLVVGCFLDAIPAIIICAPILEPLAKAVQMDPVHFAMIGIVSLAFGLVTPPYGLCLMIACAVAGIRIRDAIKDTGIMLVPMLMVLALVIVWPKASLFLPALISPEFLR
jgi:tripartite ATP-independent transporter DctM subunit